MNIEQEITSLTTYVDDLVTGLYWNTEDRLDQLEQEVKDIYNARLGKLHLHTVHSNQTQAPTMHRAA